MGKKKQQKQKGEGVRRVNVTWVFAAVTCVSILFLIISSKITVKPEPYVPPHLKPKKNPALIVKPERKVRGYQLNY